MLYVSISTLSAWNLGFDEHLKPMVVPEKRGKAAKVSAEVVRRIIEKAKACHPRRIRLKRFAAELKLQTGIDLSVKTLEEILIANDLYKARTRKKRPGFYQSLCQKVPNGLLSIDGSQMTVWLGRQPYPFNVELAVDVATFAHTAFSIGDSETAAEVIRVLESHRRVWGLPIGVVTDHGSANLSDAVKSYLDKWGIKAVPAGPANPKGNGSDEGAFSHMKKAIGPIHLDSSSPKALARSVLQALVSLYVSLRNRLPVQQRSAAPCQHMAVPVSVEQQDAQRRRLERHVASKAESEENQLKLDRLHWVIGHYGLEVAPDALKHAQRSIKHYELEAIRQTETAFLKATRRQAGRCNLSYFFGILKNIQQKMDDDAKRDYCRKRYNHEVMLKLERQKHAQSEPICIDSIIGMLSKAVTANLRFVKELAVRRARQWTLELIASSRYLKPVERKIQDALGNLNTLSIGQKEEAWQLFCQFLKDNNQQGRVTLFS